MNTKPSRITAVAAAFAAISLLWSLITTGSINGVAMIGTIVLFAALFLELFDVTTTPSSEE